MNAETTETIMPPWGDATFSARVMLEMLKIISEDTSACAAVAREAVSLSATPEIGYERALSVYMGLLGITGKVQAMLAGMSPQVQALRVVEAQVFREQNNPTNH